MENNYSLQLIVTRLPLNPYLNTYNTYTLEIFSDTRELSLSAFAVVISFINPSQTTHDKNVGILFVEKGV